MKRAWTEGPWEIEVAHSSSGSLGPSGGYVYLYHAVKIDNVAHTIANTKQRVSDVTTKKLPVSHYGPGYVQYKSRNPMPVDYTPHPNVRLVAAAPELYEALADLVAGYTSDKAKRAVAALKKAEG